LPRSESGSLKELHQLLEQMDTISSQLNGSVETWLLVYTRLLYLYSCNGKLICEYIGFLLKHHC